MVAAPVYEAYDEDDEEYLEEGGGEGEEYWVNDQVEAGGEEEEADEDDYGPGVTISWNKPLQSKPAPPVSDVPDQVYSDPMGLVNCWEEALVELKAAHPDRFLPPSDAPRSVSQRQQKAPLWHGPSTTPYPAPIASTSKLPSPSQPASPSSTPSLPPHMISTSYSTNPEPEPTKKRKRLTGSQKKARKAAKLANSGFSNGRAPAANGSKVRGEDGEEEQEGDGGSKSPEYRPQSPELAPQPDDADRAPPTQVALPTQPSPQPPRISPQPQPQAQPQQQPQQPLIAAKPAAAGRLPLTFPAPPPITPLTGAEPALDPETPESLLESALWSWYTAGYQTALYHASVGAATFKQSENGEGDE